MTEGRAGLVQGVRHLEGVLVNDSCNVKILKFDLKLFLR